MRLLGARIEKADNTTVVESDLGQGKRRWQSQLIIKRSRRNRQSRRFELCDLLRLLCLILGSLDVPEAREWRMFHHRGTLSQGARGRTRASCEYRQILKL